MTLEEAAQALDTEAMRLHRARGYGGQADKATRHRCAMAGVSFEDALVSPLGPIEFLRLMGELRRVRQ